MMQSSTLKSDGSFLAGISIGSGTTMNKEEMAGLFLPPLYCHQDKVVVFATSLV